MIRQKDYQWQEAIKIAKEEGADYVAILLGRLRDAQKEIEALEAAQQSVQPTIATAALEDSPFETGMRRNAVVLSNRNSG